MKRFNHKITLLLELVFACSLAVFFAACGGTKEVIEPTSYNLVYEASEGGSIKGESNQTVKEGEDGSVVTAVPNEGYRFVEWSDGLKTSFRNEDNVQEDVFLTAYFEEDIKYVTVRYVLHHNLSQVKILGQTVQIIPQGGNTTPVQVTVLEPGYRFFYWQDNGSTNPERMDTNIQQDTTFVAVANGPYTCNLHFRAEKGGRIEGVLDQEVLYGGDGEIVEAIPDEGYRFVRWSDGRTDAVRTNESITSYGDDPTIYAEFERYERVFQLNYNDATAGNSIQELSLTLDNFETIRFPVPQREGCKFEGWYSDWHYTVQIADEDGNLIAGRDWFDNDWWYDSQTNPEGNLYARWTSTGDIPTYKILMIYVTEVHGLFETAIDGLPPSPNDEIVQVDYVMSNIEREIYAIRSKYVEEYLNAIMNATVRFEVDTYFTTQPLSREAFNKGATVDFAGNWHVHYTLAVRNNRLLIPEVDSILDNYGSVITSYCLNDFDAKLHFGAVAGSGKKNMQKFYSKALFAN